MVQVQPRTGKLDLAKTISVNHGLSMRRSMQIVNDMVEAMFVSLSMGIPITFANLGSLKPFEDHGEVILVPSKDGKSGCLGRSREDDPAMDVVFSIAPRLREAMNNENARQTSRKYSKDNRRPRKLTRVHPRKKGKKANG